MSDDQYVRVKKAELEKLKTVCEEIKKVLHS
jgi:hypothetical protein